MYINNLGDDAEQVPWMVNLLSFLLSGCRAGYPAYRLRTHHDGNPPITPGGSSKYLAQRKLSDTVTAH